MALEIVDYTGTLNKLMKLEDKELYKWFFDECSVLRDMLTRDERRKCDIVKYAFELSLLKWDCVRKSKDVVFENEPSGSVSLGTSWTTCGLCCISVICSRFKCTECFIGKDHDSVYTYNESCFVEWSDWDYMRGTVNKVYYADRVYQRIRKEYNKFLKKNSL